MSSSIDPPIFAEKEEYFEKIQEMVSNREPQLGMFAAELYSRIKGRITPLEPESPSYSVRGADVVTVKRLLLELHPKAIKHLAEFRLPEMFPDEKSPFPDPDKPYAGIYAGGYLENEQDISIRTAIRLANILVHEDRLERAVFSGVMSDGLVTACKKLGKAWRTILKELMIWEDLVEFTLDEEDPLHSPMPDVLRRSRYEGQFPFSPLYCGYSKDPETRHRYHHRSNYLPN